MDTAQEKSQEQLDALSKMFEEFTQASSGVMEYYEHLEKTVQHLTNELESKNNQLNQQLAEIEKTRSYLNNILESISDGVIAVDFQGVVRACNKAALSIIGYTSDEVVGQSISSFVVDERLFHERTNEHVTEIAFTKSGFETALDHKSGAEVSVVLFSSPIYDENGMVIGAVLTFKDVSLIKKLEDEVERSSRLASIGEMAAGVAHEIRNPLGGIEMFASILHRDFEEGDDRKRIIQNILDGVRSIDTIVSELLNFTRTLRKTNFQELTLSEVLDSALMFAAVELEKKGATVNRQYAVSPCVILGDEDQLKQLFLNLFLNAAQALPEKGGVVSVSLQRSDDRISVVVSDNGSGIEKKNVSKIFDPFFTTKSTGNGLGLAISYRIIEAHNGSVNVESCVGQGTSFALTFKANT